jgi:hypothetical protein
LAARKVDAIRPPQLDVLCFYRFPNLLKRTSTTVRTKSLQIAGFRSSQIAGFRPSGTGLAKGTWRNVNAPAGAHREPCGRHGSPPASSRRRRGDSSSAPEPAPRASPEEDRGAKAESTSPWWPAGCGLLACPAGSPPFTHVDVRLSRDIRPFFSQCAAFSVVVRLCADFLAARTRGRPLLPLTPSGSCSNGRTRRQIAESAAARACAAQSVARS